MKRIRTILFFVALAALFINPAATAIAVEAEELTFTATHRTVTAITAPVGDVSNHWISVARREGKVELGDGQSADYKNVYLIEAWVGQKGIRQGYSTLSFQDGSSIYISETMDSARDENNLPSGKGLGTITKGTGRYKGITGTVEFTMQQLRPTSKDPQRTSVTKAVIKYTQP